MSELPNLLRQKLAEIQNGAAGLHPDADTLTAYTEQSLPPAEHQTVLAHLAMCPPCRDVIALSQSELPELAIQTVLAPAPPSRWRRLFSPAFGLAASAAAMAVIAVLVLQLPQKPAQQSQQPAGQTSQEAKVTNLQDQAAPRAARPDLTQPAENRTASAPPSDLALSDKEVQRHGKREEPVRPRIAATLAASAIPPTAAKSPTPVLTAGLVKKDYINTNFFAASGSDNVVQDSQSNRDFPAAPQPQSGSSPRAFSAKAGPITNFSDIPPGADGKSNVRILTPPPPTQHFGLIIGKVATATAHSLHLRTFSSPALRSGTLGNSALGENGMFSATLLKNQPAEAATAPERADAGSLAASEALSAGALSTYSYRARESVPLAWKVAGGKLIKSAGQSKWEDAYPAAGFEFSYVDARGNDVWAGGTHASLIHSRDGGLTWENVILGESATGTIVSIIAGAVNVQVKTSDNQIWSSTDGGKTWSMRSE
jgi:anti-sigma factor ChrR (cupin superfamily)